MTWLLSGGEARVFGFRNVFCTQGGTLDFKRQRSPNQAKIKTQQNPKKSLKQKLTPQKYHAESPSLKCFQKGLYFIRKTMRPGNVGTTVYNEPSDCFEEPIKIPIYIKPHQNILAKFSNPKHS